MARAGTPCCGGIPGPLAIEIDRQLTAGALERHARPAASPRRHRPCRRPSWFPRSTLARLSAHKLALARLER